MATTSDLKVGIVITFNNDLHEILNVEHRTPGNLRAFYQVKMRNLKNGKMIENRFRSGEEIQIERLEQDYRDEVKKLSSVDNPQE
ncbi:MAG TPA: elongation factor P, partial [Ignavibacteria bacterium]|nr:elongation factor P [Ignavibacteria bacterium]